MLQMLTRIVDKVFNTAPERYVTMSNQRFADTTFTAVDFELTSLELKTTEITSIGNVSGKNGRLLMSTCDYSIIKTTADLGQSPVIHGLTEEQLCNGLSLQVAIDKLLPYLTNSVLLFHNASLDLAALHNTFVLLGLPKIDVVYIDTLKLALYQLRKQHQVLPLESATLASCCERLGLPDFPEHNALDDAMATLSVFFAQLSQLGIEQKNKIKELAHTKSVGYVTIGK